MSTATLLAFAAVTAVAVATPGPDVLLALANGTRFGMRRALAGIGGVLLSDLMLIGAVALGLGALLAASETLFTLLKYAGVCYLAWLGFGMIRGGGTIARAGAGAPGRDRGTPDIFWKSFLVALTNPKAYIFFSALFPQFIDPAAPQLPQFAALTLCFVATESLIMLGYALVGTRAVRFVASRGAVYLERACGGALLVSAVSLALAKRASAAH